MQWLNRKEIIVVQVLAQQESDSQSMNETGLIATIETDKR